jgi:hypothetical protein
MLTELVLSYSAGFLSLVVVKAVSEPIAKRLGQMALGKAYEYLPAIFDTLDYQWLQNLGVSGTYDWLVKTIIPGIPLELSEEEVQQLADYVVKHFDLETHLKKVANHARL